MQAKALPVALVEPDLAEASSGVRERIDRARAAVQSTLDDPSAEASRVAAAVGRLGMVYAAHHLRDAALVAFANARLLEPEESRWGYYSAVVLEQSGLFDEARDALEVAHRLAPGDLAGAIRLARLHLSANELDAAERLFREVLERRPDEAAAWHGLGEVARARGDCATALTQLSRALELQPQAASIHYGLALCFRAGGDRARAQEHLSLHRDVPVRFPDPAIDELMSEAAGVDRLLQAARSAVMAGDVQQSIEIYGRAAAEDPASAPAFRGLATSLLRLGQEGLAAEALRRLLELEPENPVAHYDLALLARRRGAGKEAASLLQRACALAPDHAAAQLELGHVLAELGRTDEAEAHYRQALSLTAGGAAGARQLRGEAAAAVARLELRRATGPDDLARVAALLDEAIDLRPDDPESALLAAQVLGRAGRYREAALRYAKVVELQPRQAGPRMGGALALLLAGNEAGAKDWLDRAVSELPEDPDLRSLLARVLCCSRDDRARDPARSLALAQPLFEAAPSIERGATLAMALAANGDLSSAAELQAEVLRRARARGPAGELSALERCANEYAAGRPCLEPWR
jgi:Flp pilus assembly protein TadD